MRLAQVSLRSQSQQAPGARRLKIVIYFNRAGKRAWRQRMYQCRTVDERVRYSRVFVWAARRAAPGPEQR